jgi:hypothetical protein
MSPKVEEAVRTAESRWPVVLTVVLYVVMLTAMPSRVRLMPAWCVDVIGGLALLPLCAVALRPRIALLKRIERIAVLGFAGGAAAGNLVLLHVLIGDILRGARVVTALELLSSSIAIWVSNVVLFGLIYWQIDRGGPARRESAQTTDPDWLFPRDQAAEAFREPGWRPLFIDYLFLGFSTATAFSAADAQPLTARAKLVMMTESSISLLTLVVVAARAINVLG